MEAIRIDPEEPCLGQQSHDEPDDHSGILQEFEEITEAFHDVVQDAAIMDQVDSLREALEAVSEQVQGWRHGNGDGNGNGNGNGHKRPYLESIETLKVQVNGIQEEWYTVASTLNLQKERLESLLESFPGIIETTAMRALSLRVTHLEQLLTDLVEGSRDRSNAKRSRIQLNVSFAALAATVILWGLWIGISILS